MQSPFQVFELPIRAYTVEEHCQALVDMRRLPFWWHLGTHSIYGNYSVPFKDGNGVWWYQVKPGLCWPVEFYQPIPMNGSHPNIWKSYLGYQHITPNEEDADSHLVVNSIIDLKNYKLELLDKRRRTKVRTGLKNCSVEMLKQYDQNTVNDCLDAWNDLVRRTGWRTICSNKQFSETWRMLLEIPGISILVARDRETKRAWGFQILKVIGDTIYGDTIAVHSDGLHAQANDVLYYAWLSTGARIPEVTKANAALKSNVKSLEAFKIGIGFKHVVFPAVTRLRAPASIILRTFLPKKYKRMIGQFEESTEVSKYSAECSESNVEGNFKS